MCSQLVYGVNSTVRMYPFYLPISVDDYWVVSTFKLFIINDVVTFTGKFSGKHVFIYLELLTWE